MLTTDPPASPYTCIRCKAHAQVRNWFIDTGAEADWEGYIYICDACFTDMVRVTTDFLSVEAHREIVAEYTRGMDELAALRERILGIDRLWAKMTGQDLWLFFENLEKVSQLGNEMELSGAISSAIGDQPAIISNSPEPISDNGRTPEPDSSVEPDIIVNFG
jgi:hypothetical protein